MPFPGLERRYTEQLETLYRRREAAGVARVESELDWAIERVAAELYRVGLPTLIWLQSRSSGMRGAPGDD